MKTDDPRRGGGGGGGLCTQHTTILQYSMKYLLLLPNCGRMLQLTARAICGYSLDQKVDLLA